VKTQDPRAVLVQLQERDLTFLIHACEEDQTVRLPKLFQLMYVADISCRLFGDCKKVVPYSIMSVGLSADPISW